MLQLSQDCISLIIASVLIKYLLRARLYTGHRGFMVNNTGVVSAPWS